jgi:hypothetical protein
MNRRVNWRIFSAVMIVASLLALAVHKWLRVSFWVSLALVVLGIVVNGIVATREDEMPGGFLGRDRDKRER